MNIRETAEQFERNSLSEYATLSENSVGRARKEQKCDIRTDFARDRDRIIHCKAFRRLKQKTQVFLSPEGDHFRTRLTHTLEVSQIARTVARALRLNEDLTEAIALGHDLGHTPFGHAGERALATVCPLGFTHFAQSIRVVEKLEKNHQGLNLTTETLDGIANHTKGTWPKTLEGCVVRHADRIAFLNHDIEDAIEAGVISEDDIPKEVGQVLGFGKSERITTLIKSLVHNSSSELKFSDEVKEAYDELYHYMFKRVYLDTTNAVKSEEYKAVELVSTLYNYYVGKMERLPKYYQEIASRESLERAAADYISGMSDGYAIYTFEKKFMPHRWKY